MKQTTWLLLAVALLCVMTLTGCEALVASGLLTNTNGKVVTPIPSAELKTATTSGKTVATKSSGKVTGAPTAKPKAATAKPKAAIGRIAFVSSRGGNNEIYIMNADGSDQQQLTMIGEYTVNPAWSPDGNKLAFISDKFGEDYGTAEIYVCDANGANITRLTNNRFNEFQPAWSPDGTKIAFASEREDNYDIYVVNADGSGETRLTTDPGVDWQPDWSPDGQRIIFSSSSGGKNLDVYVMNADGSGSQRLTDTAYNNTESTYSPDGKLIAFIAAYDDGSSALCVMQADGSGLKELITSKNADLINPDWSPDGTMLAYADRPSGGVRSEVYIVNADGSDPTRITENAFADFFPVWMPQ